MRESSRIFTSLFLLLFLFFVTSQLGGCSKIVSNSHSLTLESLRKGDQLGLAIEAVVTSMVTTADEVSGQGFVNASAGECNARAGEGTCNSGVRSTRYQGCRIPGTLDTLSGPVKLSFGDEACDLSAEGQEIVETLTLVHQTSSGSLLTSSDNHMNYLNRTIGGGARIVRLSGNDYALGILGLRKQLADGQELSLHSNLETQISTSAGLLERNGRKMNGGAIILDHNEGGYSVAVEPQNLSFEASCCYPSAGQLRLTYSGRLQGTGTVKITGCGSAELDALGEKANLQFHSCD